jgi:uridine kinase
VERVVAGSWFVARDGTVVDLAAADLGWSVNYDHPDALETALLVDHVRCLLAGRSVRVPVYDFSTHTRSTETVAVAPKRAIVLEGILVLADADLRRLMDIKVFVDTDSDLRMIRRLERDVRERGRSMESVVSQYLDTVRPMHIEFVEPTKRHAHVIIPEGGQNTVAVDMLITKVRAIARSG